MTTLAADQIIFLKKHKIAEEDVFYAKGMSKRDREAAMKAAGKRFYFGGAPCDAASHTLRTKQGHCIQCDTSKIAYATRHSSPGCLYVAGSLAGRCVKIGSTGDVEARVIRLRSEAYGGFSDWEMLAATSIVPDAGAIEDGALRSLTAYKKEGRSIKSNKLQVSYELLSCNFGTASKAVMDLLPHGYSLKLLRPLSAAQEYDWFVPA